MIVYLSKQKNNLYMITRTPPVQSTIGATEDKDFYVPYGDAIGVRNLCSVIADLAGDKAKNMKPLETIRIDIVIKAL